MLIASGDPETNFIAQPSTTQSMPLRVMSQCCWLPVETRRQTLLHSQVLHSLYLLESCHSNTDCQWRPGDKLIPQPSTTQSIPSASNRFFFSTFLMGETKIFGDRQGRSRMGGGGTCKKIRLKPKLPTQCKIRPFFAILSMKYSFLRYLRPKK